MIKTYRGIINTIKSNELCHYLPETRKVEPEVNSTTLRRYNQGYNLKK